MQLAAKIDFKSNDRVHERDTLDCGKSINALRVIDQNSLSSGKTRIPIYLVSKINLVCRLFFHL